MLTAFQVGDECVRLTEAYGHAIALDAYRRQPESVALAFAEVGLKVVMQMVRQPQGREKVPQAYLLARKVCS